MPAISTARAIPQPAFVCYLCSGGHYYADCVLFKGNCVIFVCAADGFVYRMDHPHWNLVTMADVYGFVSEKMRLTEMQVRFKVGNAESACLAASCLAANAFIMPGVVVIVELTDSGLAWARSQQQQQHILYAHHQQQISAAAAALLCGQPCLPDFGPSLRRRLGSGSGGGDVIYPPFPTTPPKGHVARHTSPSSATTPPRFALHDSTPGEQQQQQRHGNDSGDSFTGTVAHRDCNDLRGHRLVRSHPPRHRGPPLSPEQQKEKAARIACTLYVKNLPEQMQSAAMRTLFDEAGGKVLRVRVAKLFPDDLYLFAFVEYVSTDDAAACIKTLNQHMIDGYKLVAEQAKQTIHGWSVCDADDKFSISSYGMTDDQDDAPYVVKAPRRDEGRQHLPHLPMQVRQVLEVPVGVGPLPLTRGLALAQVPLVGVPPAALAERSERPPPVAAAPGPLPVASRLAAAAVAPPQPPLLPPVRAPLFGIPQTYRDMCLDFMREPTEAACVAALNRIVDREQQLAGPCAFAHLAALVERHQLALVHVAVLLHHARGTFAADAEAVAAMALSPSLVKALAPHAHQASSIEQLVVILQLQIALGMLFEESTSPTHARIPLGCFTFASTMAAELFGAESRPAVETQRILAAAADQMAADAVGRTNVRALIVPGTHNFTGLLLDSRGGRISCW